MNNHEHYLPSLQLRVNNSHQLESGCNASHDFGPAGGSVGSNEQNVWRIQDTLRKIAGTHFVILWQDDAFCLRTQGAPVSVNQTPLNPNIGIVRLLQGDEITLGELTLKTLISVNGGEIQDPLQVTPESLVTHYSNPLESLLEQDPKHDQVKITAPSLEQTVANSWSQDPLRVLQNKTLTEPGIDPVTTENSAESILQRSPDGKSGETFSLTDDPANRVVDQEFLELPQITSYLNKQKATVKQEDMSDRFVAMTPLMRGLNAPLSMYDSQQANDFLEEAGRTLQMTIRGLLALQSHQDTLSDKHLRPLEDNPLRLNMDYDTTLNVLFAEGKSPVHLSAPEAVAESLDNMRLHYQANQQAISEALSVMLEAFAPGRLMSRFAQYRRVAERSEMDPAWAWTMYCNYYEELASSRQQGFGKLFNEVYEQAYDRALRKGLQESKV
ncbi:type VI secretion system-associated FHA domain protein TagH [Trabulsiella odontotermitis]|uniref:type VI secretion system-associated FHA domain protein TagH n=1 Tax=Trabulsiella odontotermitis TaxID=379893 RepID=UPI000675DE04|nr:type VI secretion system-associated FHA domain protein TagH [Trabulsiella odontotermitis]KNC89670.1 phosphopeptide-binding protein [Trabulsiella odontotermitis]